MMDALGRLSWQEAAGYVKRSVVKLRWGATRGLLAPDGVHAAGPFSNAQRAHSSIINAYSLTSFDRHSRRLCWMDETENTRT